MGSLLHARPMWNALDGEQCGMWDKNVGSGDKPQVLNE